MSIGQKSIAELSKAYANGISSVFELFNEMRSNLMRSKQFIDIYISENPRLEHQIAESARNIETSQPRSILEGIPISIKDNFCTKDMSTTCASRMLNDFRPNYDAAVVERLMAGGAVVVGKTNMDEFGMGSCNLNTTFGDCTDKRTTNSTGAGRVVGGSSGGSAASLLFGTSVVSIGTDTGGSVRNPASHCQLLGFKPSFGSISRYGLVPYAHSLDTVGIIGRAVNDIEAVFGKNYGIILLAIIRGKDSRDMTSIDIDSTVCADKNIGLLCPEEKMHPLFKSIFPKHDGQFVKVPAEMPDCKRIIDAYYTIACCEAFSNLAKFNGAHEMFDCLKTKLSSQQYSANRQKLLGKEALSRIAKGAKILRETPEKLAQSYQIMQETKRCFERLFERYSFIITLTTTHVAPFSNEINSADEYYFDCLNIPISLAGIPSLSVPLTKFNCDSRLSIQLLAPHRKDLSIFHLLANDFPHLEDFLAH